MESFSKSSVHRHMRVLAGPPAWCREQARALLADAAKSEVLWLGEGEPAHGIVRHPREARQLLGQEFSALVVDAHVGLDPEALGAASGTLIGGGWLLLLSPPLDAWARFDDPQHQRIAVAPFPASAVSGRFLGRLARILGEHGVVIYTPEHPPSEQWVLPTLPSGNRGTPDQYQAVQALLHLARSRARRPLVLIAHRGRGKSAALGMAAAELSRQSALRILVTAPRRAQVESLFAQLDTHSTAAFWAPDALLRERPAADLLLVDEAAAIPTPLLSMLLQHYPRIAFATTIHGYEGTGQGFALRFRKLLDQQTPGWRELRLQTPIRWAANDPLEALIFDMLLLDAEPVDGEQLSDVQVADCQLQTLDPIALASDENTLRELFGLLILAHYQTSPLDLRYLLDGPNVGGFLLRYQGHVVGVVLTTREGGLDAQLARAVRDNRRRPRGHLLPQTIAAHLGREEAVLLHSVRVMRIAVHPALQGRGLGKRLLEAVAKQARAEHIDMLGSSFAATPELLDFWSSAGLHPVRLGFRRDAASGAHSALVLQGLTVAGKALVDDLRERFMAHLPQLLSDPLRELPAALVVSLLAERPVPISDAAERQDLEDFLSGCRGYEDTLVAVRNAVLAGFSEPHRVTQLGQHIRDTLVLRVVQQHPWEVVAQRLELAGRAAVLAALRAGLKHLAIAEQAAIAPDPAPD